MNIFELTHDEFVAEVHRLYEKGRFHASAAYREVFKKGNFNFSNVSEFTACPAFAARISRECGGNPLREIRIVQDGAIVKFISTLVDGAEIESVIIPNAGRTTLCISSQVGCRFNCSFCATGARGFVRDLTVEEIVRQVYSARFTLTYQIDNIVFMGMGEPLDNFNAVIQSLRVISDQRGLSIPLRRVTISTAGHADGIARLGRLALKNLRLAISINAADDALRTGLMPINYRFPLQRLKKELRAYPLGKRGVLFLEYVLLAGVNDSKEHARQLSRFVKDLPARINLIPYNPSAALPHQALPPEKVEQFRAWLVEENLFVRVRRSHGEGIMAACGQLCGKTAKKN